MDPDNTPALGEAERLIEDALGSVAIVTCPECENGKLALEYPCPRCRGKGVTTTTREGR